MLSAKMVANQNFLGCHWWTGNCLSTPDITALCQ